MLITVTSAKGGVGATTVAAAIGLAAPDGSTLVDLTGDLGAVLGTPDDLDVGVVAWLASDAPTERLDELTIGVDHSDSAILRTGAPAPDVAMSVPIDRWSLLLGWCARRSTAERPVVIDTGANAPAIRAALGDAPAVELLVTRACYLALRRARASTGGSPDGIVLVVEPGRAVRLRDVERALGVPVVATMPWDPSVARSIDAGLVTAGVPASMRRTGRAVMRSLGHDRHGRWAA